MKLNKGYPYILDAALIDLSSFDKEQTKEGRIGSKNHFISALKSGLLGTHITDKQAHDLLDELSQRMLLVHHPDDFAEDYYEVSAKFIETIEDRVHDEETPLAKTYKFGDYWMASALENVFCAPLEEFPFDISEDPQVLHIEKGDAPSKAEEIPASNRIVSLDDNKPEDRELIETLDTIYSEASKSNEFGALFADPDERQVVLSEMESSISLVKGKKFKAATITALLIPTLTFIADKLSDAALGALASKALELFGPLLGG